MENIKRIKYSISHFDIVQMKSGISCIIDLKSDGCLTIKNYVLGSRKARDMKKYIVKSEDFSSLCDSLRQCIEKANTVIQYIDDSDAKLSIYYPFGRVETMPRGLGDEEHTVGSIFTEFICRYCDK